METVANLVVRLKSIGYPHWKIFAVKRICLDGHGRIILWDVDSAEPETIDLAVVEEFVIESVADATKAQ